MDDGTNADFIPLDDDNNNFGMGGEGQQIIKLIQGVEGMGCDNCKTTTTMTTTCGSVQSQHLRSGTYMGGTGRQQ